MFENIFFDVLNFVADPGVINTKFQLVMNRNITLVFWTVLVCIQTNPSLFGYIFMLM